MGHNITTKPSAQMNKLLSHSSLLRRTMFVAMAVAVIMACNRFDEPPMEVVVPEGVNISIRDLRSMVGNRTVHFEDEIIIGGYVTTSDAEDNFYRTLCIEDFTGGVELMAGMYDLHRIYPEGCYLTVALRGCSAGLHNGVLQVGPKAAAYSNYPTDYFSSRVELDRHVKRYNLNQRVAPLPLRIDQLAEKYCGRLVNITRLKLHSTTNNGTWSGYTIFTDENGRRVAVYTSPYATYAGHEVPTERVAITGILQHASVEGEPMYIIKMRYESDCHTID